MNRLFVLALLLMSISFPIGAAGLKCSVYPPKNTPAASLAGLAKLSQADAEKAALADIKATSKEVVDGELEVEHGCLVYSFDIRVQGKPGLEEIMVDGGTGKVISHKHESPKQEAAEKAKDAAAAKSAR